MAGRSIWREEDEHLLKVGNVTMLIQIHFNRVLVVYNCGYQRHNMLLAVLYTLSNEMLVILLQILWVSP